MLAGLSMLVLAAAFLLMTGCAYHEYTTSAGTITDGADRHHATGHHKPNQHPNEEQKCQHHKHRQPDREAGKHTHR
ncbi:hypothetical protein [Pseudomonas sp. CC6-YY-74]|uniref:hypothetical protein n=1 Tax=Pseudomonas sp. CC6-YY-74 TaxID=1930532 RepID=UPI0012AC1F8F|nr:hypothetical protein [Pseudomonas sp. CC6-YY-74]